jgi:hypothetical protein
MRSIAQYLYQNLMMFTKQQIILIPLVIRVGVEEEKSRSYAIVITTASSFIYIRNVKVKNPK